MIFRNLSLIVLPGFLFSGKIRRALRPRPLAAPVLVEAARAHERDGVRALLRGELPPLLRPPPRVEHARADADGARRAFVGEIP